MVAYWLTVPAFKNSFQQSSSFVQAAKSVVIKYSWQRRAPGDFHEPGEKAYAGLMPARLPVAYNGVHGYVQF